MGLGGTAKKIQKIADAAEKLYSKMNEVISELKDLQQSVENTSDQVDHLERDVAEQRAILEALAEQQGVDIEAVLEDADLPPEPSEAEETDTTETDGDGTTVPVEEEQSATTDS